MGMRRRRIIRLGRFRICSRWRRSGRCWSRACGTAPAPRSRRRPRQTFAPPSHKQHVPGGRVRMRMIVRGMLTAIVLVWTSVAGFAGPTTMKTAIPEDFPRFVVPGHEADMTALRELFYHHYHGNGPACTLWDEWLPNALLWPAGGERSDTS